VRMEKRLLKVLKAFAEYHDLTPGAPSSRGSVKDVPEQNGKDVMKLNNVCARVGFDER